MTENAVQPHPNEPVSIPKIKLLYIVSAARSGSTLASILLDRVEGFFSGMEISFIWHGILGDLPNPRCGCGKSYNECIHWTAVFQEAFGGFDKVDPHEMLEQRAKVKTRLINSLFPNRPRKLYEQPGFKAYMDATAKIYQAIYKTTGGKVIVDASKSQPYLHILESLPFLEIYILHIVRDSRGVVFSQIQNPKTPRESESALYNLRTSILTAVRWMRMNFEAMRLSRDSKRAWRYKRVRYEDLVAQPKALLGEIFAFMNEDSNHLVETYPFIGDHAVEFGENHSVAGNRIRFQRGVTELRQDMAWQTKMSFLDKWVVTFLTLPFLLLFRYPIRGNAVKAGDVDRITKG